MHNCWSAAGKWDIATDADWLNGHCCGWQLMWEFSISCLSVGDAAKLQLLTFEVFGSACCCCCCCCVDVVQDVADDVVFVVLMVAVNV